MPTWFCGTLTRATTLEISITVTSGVPGVAISPAYSGRSADHAGDRADDLRVAHLRLRRLQVAARRLHLRGRRTDLFLLADALQRAQMFLRGEQRAVGLRVGHLRIVHQLARQRALLEQLLAVVEQTAWPLPPPAWRRRRRSAPSPWLREPGAAVMARRLASACATCAWLSAAPAVRSRFSSTASSWPCFT